MWFGCKSNKVAVPLLICMQTCKKYHVLPFPSVQLKKHKRPPSRRQTTLQTINCQSCLRSSPCTCQSQGTSLPTWTASVSWRARCGIYSISWVRPREKTNCWTGSSAATRWHCSISKTQRAAYHRLVSEMLSQMWIIATSPCAQDVQRQNTAFGGSSSFKVATLLSV